MIIYDQSSGTRRRQVKAAAAETRPGLKVADMAACIDLPVLAPLTCVRAIGHRAMLLCETEWWPAPDLCSRSSEASARGSWRNDFLGGYQPLKDRRRKVH